jgi:tripeptide aminopeptidase
MIRRTGGPVIAIAALVACGAYALAQSDAAAIDTAYQGILASAPVAKALSDIKADDARTLEEQKFITAIPAPPFKERVRAEYFLKRFKELGLPDASIDGEGNVIGLRKGASPGPKLVVSAHLDTVFLEGTDVSVKEKDGMLLAPGIGDDSRGLTLSSPCSRR